MDSVRQGATDRALGLLNQLGTFGHDATLAVVRLHAGFDALLKAAVLTRGPLLDTADIAVFEHTTLEVGSLVIFGASFKELLASLAALDSVREADIQLGVANRAFYGGRTHSLPLSLDSCEDSTC